tara:strand:+ start:32992 stop:33510 length:519 start_codon:yes stop_codon:yes gene_type:complete
MSDAVFDGDNLYITLPSLGSYNAEVDLYSAWKEWIILVDNAKFPIAFSTTGGDDIGSGDSLAPAFFVRNDLGWRIKMPSASGEIKIDGNIFPRDPTLDMFEATDGFDAFVSLKTSANALVVSADAEAATITTGDINAIAAKVWDTILEDHLTNGTTGKKLNDNLKKTLFLAD